MGDVAFAILAHQDPAMTRRLAAALAPHPVVVHVDASADAAPFADIPDVRLVRDRVDVHWGGWSQVEAMIRLHRDAVEELGDAQDAHVALLSGADYPVRPLDELVDHLATAGWSEHVRAIPVLDGTPYMEHKVRRRHFFDALPVGGSRVASRVRAVGRRSLAAGLPRRRVERYAPLQPMWGSTWTVLSRPCLDDLLPQAQDPRVQRLFRHTQSPDELLLPTLVHSHPVWSQHTERGPEPRDGRWPSEFPNLHYVHPSLGVWLDASHSREIVDSGAFFARKIRSADLDHVLAGVEAARAEAPGPATPRRDGPRA